MFASMETKRNCEELKFDSGVICALGGDGYRMQETAWGGGCCGGRGHNCVLSLLLDILQVGNCDQTSEFRIY